jgi:hypothetical protein
MKRLRFADKVLGLFAVGLFLLIAFLFRLAGAAVCPPCTSGYGFAGLNAEVHTTPDIIGSKADISFHSVQLCNEDIYDPDEPQSLPYNHSTAWTMVVGHNSSLAGAGSTNFNIWIQTGWIRSNNEMSPALNRVFFEMGKIVNGVHYPERWIRSNTTPSGTKEYKVEQSDKSTGEWKVYYDGATTAWGTETADYWKGLVGKQSRNKGEVNKLETDMPGTNSNRCVLENLQYLLEGNTQYEDQDTFANSSSTDASKWGHNRVSDTKVEIWDKVNDCND